MNSGSTETVLLLGTGPTVIVNSRQAVVLSELKMVLHAMTLYWPKWGDFAVPTKISPSSSAVIKLGVSISSPVLPSKIFKS